MPILVFILAAFCIIIVFILLRPMPDGHTWLKWNIKRKIDYTAHSLSTLKRKGKAIQKPPDYYVKELDVFYIKDDMNLSYNITNVLTNLVRLHEH